jgi:hypothetical protein
MRVASFVRSVLRCAPSCVALVLSLTCLLVTTAGVGVARAQEGEWLILPSSVAHEAEGVPTSRRAAQQLARALASGTPRLFAPERARARFEQRGSTAPLMVSHGDLDALARDAQMALYHVASGLPTKARQDVERALSRADKVLESLNRESLAAQQLLDACLYLVRAHLQINDRQRARDQARECKRLVPDIEPDGTMHPPDVIGILAEAEAELRIREPGSLRVESTPEGCAVYINGRHLGESPYELPQLGPGEYRVQAECEEGRAGRVHRVTLGTARVIKRIDTRFDAAIQTSLDIALRYDSAEAQRVHAYADALEVGRTVGVAEVLLALPIMDEKGQATTLVQVDRIRMRDARLVGAVRLSVDNSGAIEAEALAGAARDLRAGERRDYASAPPVPIADLYAVAAAPPAEGRVRVAGNGGSPGSRSDAAPVPASSPSAADVATSAALAARAGPAAESVLHSVPPSDDRAARTRHPSTLGIVLGATGGAATLVSWALFVRQLGLERGYSDQKSHGEDYSATLSDLNGSEYTPLIVGAAGSLVLTASLPWLLPDSASRKLPPLAIASGAFGGAMVIVGTVYVIRGMTCDQFDIEGRCKDMLAMAHLGPLLLAGAAPFLAVPLVYLLRPGDQARDTSVSLLPAPDGRGASLLWRGRL